MYIVYIIHTSPVQITPHNLFPSVSPWDGRHSGITVSVLDSGWSSPGSSTGWDHCVVFLDKALSSHSASQYMPHSVNINGYQTKMLGGDLRWTSIPSWGSSNTQWQIQGEGQRVWIPLSDLRFFAFAIIHSKTISNTFQSLKSQNVFGGRPLKHPQLDRSTSPYPLPSHAYPKHGNAVWKALTNYCCLLPKILLLLHIFSKPCDPDTPSHFMLRKLGKTPGTWITLARHRLDHYLSNRLSIYYYYFWSITYFRWLSISLTELCID